MPAQDSRKLFSILNALDGQDRVKQIADQVRAGAPSQGGSSSDIPPHGFTHETKGSDAVDHNAIAFDYIDHADFSELTIDAAGAITVTQTCHTVDTNADAASDNLDTINGGVNGMFLVIRPENDTRTVVVRHNQGNIWLKHTQDITLDDIRDALILMYDGTKWMDLGADSLSNVLIATLDANSNNIINLGGIDGRTDAILVLKSKLQSVGSAFSIQTPGTSGGGWADTERFYIGGGAAEVAGTFANIILAGIKLGGNIVANSNKITGLAAGSGAGDSLRYEQLTAHTSTAGAHHTKYTDAEVDAIVATHTGIAGAHHAKYTDAEVDAIVATHTAIAAAHHTKYTDAEAVTAAKTVKLDDLATPDDNTDLDVGIVRHGLVPKGTNVGDFLKDDGTWAAAGGGGTLDAAYTAGQIITVDAAGNLVFNLATTTDFIIQDNGTPVHSFLDTGKYVQGATNDNALAIMSCAATGIDKGPYASGNLWAAALTHDSGTESGGGFVTLRTIKLDLVENTDWSAGATGVFAYTGELNSTLNGIISGTASVSGATPLSSIGIYGGAKNNTVITTSGQVNRATYGLQFVATIDGSVNKTGTLTDTAIGVWATATQAIAFTAAGIYTANLYGGKFLATGGVDGTQTAYGVHATGSGADTNYGGYFVGDSYVQGDLEITGTFTDGRTRIKILGHMFTTVHSYGNMRPVDVTGDQWFTSYTPYDAVAHIVIPTGYKATHVMIYGADATNTVAVYENEIDDGTTAVSKGSGNVNTEVDITDVSASTTNYLSIEVNMASTSSDAIYGGYVTIAKI